jgi:hypothetical protein
MHQNTSLEVQQQLSPNNDGSFHTPRSQPDPNHVSLSGEQESSPSVTKRQQGQDRCTKSMRARRRPGAQ